MDCPSRDLPQALAELAQLHRSHELLVSTLDAASDGIVTLLHSDGSIYYNIRFVEMWNIPEDKLGEVSKASLIELMLSRVKDPAALAARIEQRSLHPEAEDLSILELTDGRVLERRVTPQRIQSQCVGSVITFRDVTERMRYEGKMRFSSLVVEHSGPMIWIDPAEETLTYGNEAACDALGYSSEEFVGMPLRSIVADFSGRSLTLDGERAASRRQASGIGASVPPQGRQLARRRSDDVLPPRTTSASLMHRDLQGHHRPEASRAAAKATASDPAVAHQFDPRPDFLQGRRGPLPGLQHDVCRRRGPARREIPGLNAHDLYPQAVADALDTRDKAVLERAARAFG